MYLTREEHKPLCRSTLFSQNFREFRFPLVLVSPAPLARGVHGEAGTRREILGTGLLSFILFDLLYLLESCTIFKVEKKACTLSCKIKLSTSWEKNKDIHSLTSKYSFDLVIGLVQLWRAHLRRWQRELGVLEPRDRTEEGPHGELPKGQGNVYVKSCKRATWITLSILVGRHTVENFHKERPMVPRAVM